MDRRKFLKLFSTGFPIMALPTATASIHALTNSYEAKQTLKNIVMNTDGVYISNCHFRLSGNVQLNGDYQTITACHFELNNAANTYAVEIKNQPKT